MKKLISKFKAWELTEQNGLTLDECNYLLSHHKVDIEYYTYIAIVNYRDYLYELEY